MDSRRRNMVLGSLLVAMFLAAMEGTIVATAMPTIIGDLGGFALFAWVFSLFLLAQVATIPIYGRLSDVIGRKRVFAIGVIIFLVGSLLCGAAKSMDFLIIARVIQGVGAGAVLPVASTIVGDIYSLQERARVQGYISSAWALASVAGPTLGGLIVQTIGWSWIFWINIPIGLLALTGLWVFHREILTKKKHAIDWLGSLTLVIGASSLILALVQGGVVWAWSSPPSYLSFAGFAVFAALFIWRESRAKEPILPLDLMKRRSIAVANLIALVAGGITYGITSFTPTFAQGVLGVSSLAAGLIIATLSIGWPVAATLSGPIIIRRGYRFTGLISLFIILAAALLFALLLKPGVNPWVLAGVTTIFGFGLGGATTTSLLAVQTVVPYAQRGVSTGANMFARTLGSALWVAILGSVMNSVVTSRLSALHRVLGGAQKPGQPLDITNVLLDPAQRLRLGAAPLRALAHTLAAGIDHAFWWVFATAAVGVSLGFLMPKGVPTEAEKQGDAAPT
ncbi:MAG: MDR family MFS transporter [Bacilli bacterium]